MSKIIVHIGTHKTATTTIQQRFWSFAPELADHGLVYPLLSDSPGHHGLVVPWSPAAEEYRLPGGTEAAFAQIAQDYGDSDYTVLLSSEEFSRAEPKGGVNYDALRRLLDGFDEIEIICLLRPQWQFIQSVYLELSKAMSPPRPPELISPALNRGVFAGMWADYTRLLDRLEAAFGPENITLMDFETCRSAEGGVMGTLLRHLGLDPEDEALKPMVTDAGAANVSPPPLAGWASNILSEPKPAPVWLRRRAQHFLVQEYGPRARSCLFTRAEFDRLKDHFDPINAELTQRRQPYQPDFVMAPADRSALTLFREDIGVSFWLQFCRNLAQEMLLEERKGSAGQ